MQIFINQKNFKEKQYEFVERKGKGHPDTLSDALAEELSVNYSNYTLDRFGVVLHHNFDKVGLLGGASHVVFGEGYLTSPIRILLNGRASTKFGNKSIPVRDLLIKWTRNFFKSRLVNINIEKDLDFHYNLSCQSSPGKTYEKKSIKGTRRYWFEPRGLYDIQEMKRLISNDTSLGVGYAPYTSLEIFILNIENMFSSPNYKRQNPWIGSDIKIMGFRNKNDYFITLCIPQISNCVKNLAEYKSNLKMARNTIYSIAKKYSINKLELNINTRDNFKTMELYLTATGSSIESGDEGLVGRGNRINGIISPNKPMSMEGVCGKNPIYHIGKLYYVAANEIAKKIYKKFAIPNEIFLVSQSGRDLLNPWLVLAIVPIGFNKENEIRLLINREIKSIPAFTKNLLAKKYNLY